MSKLTKSIDSVKSVSYVMVFISVASSEGLTVKVLFLSALSFMLNECTFMSWQKYNYFFKIIINLLTLKNVNNIIIQMKNLKYLLLIISLFFLIFNIFLNSFFRYRIHGIFPLVLQKQVV